MERRRLIPVPRTIRAAAIGGALVLALAACGSSATQTGAAAGSSAKLCSNIPAGPIKVSNIVPLSGPTAIDGQLTVDLSTVAVDYFNAHGSVCGHKFELSNYNDKGDPATSLGIARELVSGGNPIVMIDSFSSPQNQIQPYLMQQHVLVVNGDAAYALFNPQQNPTAFSVLPSNVQHAQLAVNWAVSHHYNDVGILSDGTSASVELAADVESAVKAAGLKFIKTITYSPTSLDLTVPVTQARQAGIQTLIPTGFTGIQPLFAAIKQVGWSPHVIGPQGAFAGNGVTTAQAPPGTVDECYFYYTTGKPTSTLLTPTVTALLKAAAGKVGTNPSTASILYTYLILDVIKYAIEKANSLDGSQLATVLESTHGLPTIAPGIDLSWSANQQHNGYPTAALRECTLQPGQYDIFSTAS